MISADILTVKIEIEQPDVFFTLEFICHEHSVCYWKYCALWDFHKNRVYLTDLSMQETFSTLFSLTSCSCLVLHEAAFIKNNFWSQLFSLNNFNPSQVFYTYLLICNSKHITEERHGNFKFALLLKLEDLIPAHFCSFYFHKGTLFFFLVVMMQLCKNSLNLCR